MKLQFPRRKPRTPEPAADPEPDRCTKTTLAGKRCQFPRHGDSPYCRLHEEKEGDAG